MLGVNIRTEWLIMSDMFKYAYRKGLNIDELAELLLTTQYGYEVISEKRHSEYADGLFMLSGFKLFSDLEGDCRGKYSDDLAITCGHFYKYWYDKGFINTKEMYRLAKPSIIWDNFATLHISGYNYWIEYLQSI